LLDAQKKEARCATSFFPIKKQIKIIKSLKKMKLINNSSKIIISLTICKLILISTEAIRHKKTALRAV